MRGENKMKLFKFMKMLLHVSQVSRSVRWTSLEMTFTILFASINICLASSPDEPKDKILEPGVRLLLAGPYGGIDYNIHRGKFVTSDGRFTCCDFNEGTGIAPVFGVKAFIPITDALSLSPRIAYEGRGGEFKQTKNDVPILGLNNTIEYLNVEEKLNAFLPTLTLDVFGSYTMTSFGLYVAAGPSFGMLLSKKFETTETILGPPGVKYLDGSTTKTFPDQEVEMNSVFISLRGGVGVVFPISGTIYFNPEVLYSFPLNKASKTNEWKISSVQATLGILFLI